jgi:hypothetical protein
MNSAIHLQTVPFIARPIQQITPYIWTLQRAHISHITKSLSKSLISFAINALQSILSFLCVFSTSVSFVFNHIQPLFCKMGGWVYLGADRSRPQPFAAGVRKEYLDSLQIENRQDEWLTLIEGAND